MFIYCIENKTNGNKYVGLTKGRIENRWKQHKIESNKGTKRAICSAIRKYGKNGFNISELERCTSLDHLREQEKFWIKELDTKNSGYNETDGGEGTFGRKWSDERKQHLSEVRKAYFSDDKNRTKQSERMKQYYKDNPVSQETRDKLGDLSRGHVVTQETRDKMSKNRSGIPSKLKGTTRPKEVCDKMSKNSGVANAHKIVYESGEELESHSLMMLAQISGISRSKLKYALSKNDGYLKNHKARIYKYK